MSEVVYCFAYDDPGRVHLKGARDSKTLCGARAFPSSLPGRKMVTCETCRKKKPKVLGGEPSR